MKCQKEGAKLENTIEDENICIEEDGVPGVEDGGADLLGVGLELGIDGDNDARARRDPVRPRRRILRRIVLDQDRHETKFEREW